MEISLSQELYETIFKRKSIRKFDPSPLDEKTLSPIKSFMDSLTPLDSSISVKGKLVAAQEIKGLFHVKAPHYIVILSRREKGYLTNAGFMYQQMDLFLSAQGLGCCWQGMAKPTQGEVLESGFEVISVLAFGKPAEPLHRQSPLEFKRKPLQEITDIADSSELLEPCRLSPSAVNGQPWFFSGSSKEIQVHYVKANFLQALIYDRLHQIDLGIALCHLCLSALHAGKDFTFILADQGKPSRPSAPAGYHFLGSVRLSASERK